MTNGKASYLTDQWTDQLEQPMRNTVKVLDPSYPNESIFALEPGEMFQYADNKDPTAVYMKLDGFGKGNAAVYLVTGMYYIVSGEAKIRRISHVQIGSKI